MKRFILAGVLALALAAVTEQQASANFKFSIGGSFHTCFEFSGCSWSCSYSCAPPSCYSGSCYSGYCGYPGNAYAPYYTAYNTANVYDQGAGTAAVQSAPKVAPTNSMPRPATYAPAAVYPVAYYPNMGYNNGYNAYGYGATPAYWYGR